MTSEQKQSQLPLPEGYSFSVDICKELMRIPFKRTDGLSPKSIHNMPGSADPYPVHFFDGLFERSQVDDFLRWYDAIKMGEARRNNITVTLYDEDNKPAARWLMTEALPVKVGTQHGSKKGNVVLSSVVFICEKITPQSLPGRGS